MSELVFGSETKADLIEELMPGNYSNFQLEVLREPEYLSYKINNKSNALIYYLALKFI